MPDLNKGGRPRKYETVGELEEAVNSYFELLKDESGRQTKPATISGLAFHLGFDSRQSFYDYEKDERFSYTIKRARLAIEEEYESALRLDKSATGAIFWLKNAGWHDKTETESTTKIELALSKKEIRDISEALEDDH